MSETDFIAAPCLREGAIAAQGRELVAASRRLGESRWAGVLRAWCVPYLFCAMEEIFSSDAEPNAAVNEALGRLTVFLDSGAACDFPLPETSGNGHSEGAGSPVEEITGEHYGRLFRRFSDSSYWEEPARLLKERLERNGISLADIEGKSVIDVGCGGGRYSAAWRLLGAGKVVGCDISATGIADARRRVENAGIDNVTFEQCNVLSLPFDEGSFDIVYSNGVLHHTVDWEKGVAELVRVLKPGGLGWLYLIENPGGLFWDLIEIMRVVMHGEDKAAARNALRMIGVPANRVFYMLDHVLVPINLRLTPAEIESCLERAGASDVRRLTRGADFDRIEQIYQRRPYASVKYGVGENRYVFSRRA